MDDQIEKLSNLINEDIELGCNYTMEENFLSIQNKNKNLKLLLQEILNHYKSKDLRNKSILVQCSNRLKLAVIQLKRQKQIINHLKKKIHGSDTNDDVPDSTTEN